MFARLVLQTSFLRSETTFHWLRKRVGGDGVSLHRVSHFHILWLFLMHTDEGDVVDETKVSALLLAFVIEKARDTLDVLVFDGLQGELLSAVVVNDTRGADVLAAGIEHTQTYVQVDVIIFSSLLDEDRREGEDELVTATETGVSVDGEALLVEQLLVAQGQKLG